MYIRACTAEKKRDSTLSFIALIAYRSVRLAFSSTTDYGRAVRSFFVNTHKTDLARFGAARKKEIEKIRQTRFNSCRCNTL